MKIFTQDPPAFSNYFHIVAVGTHVWPSNTMYALHSWSHYFQSICICVLFTGLWAMFILQFVEAVSQQFEELYLPLCVLAKRAAMASPPLITHQSRDGL